MPYSKLSVDSSTRLCCLIGDPVAQSPSPAMHNAAFQSLKLNFIYLSFRVASKHLREALEGLRAMGVRGFNVTMPHKEAVAKLVDELDDVSRDLGAVNTVVNEDGRLLGFNTDVEGFTKPLKDRKVSLKGRRTLILGAGGAARACIAGLIREGATQFTILNRRPERVFKLTSDLKDRFDFEAKVARLDRDGIVEALGSVDMVVNTTPIGMYPNVSESPIPGDLLRRDMLVYDIVYKPLKTKLIKHAESMGATGIPGYEMLVAQAEESFRLWTGHDAPRGVMKRTAVKILEAYGS